MKRYQASKKFKITLTILFVSIMLILVTPFIHFPLLHFMGLGGLIVGIVFFFTVGGVTVVYVKPFEDSKTYKECAIGTMYNLEERLKKEKQKMQELYAEQRDNWKWARSGAGIFFAGVFTIVFCYLMANIFPPLVLGIFPGIYVVWMSFPWFWHAFINSDVRLAKEIAEMFMLRTIPIKMEETSKLIGVLTKRVREKQQKEEERRLKEGDIPMWFGPGVWEGEETKTEGMDCKQTDLEEMVWDR